MGSMTDEESLLAAIIANRYDNLPRLVYADYLEERGGPNDLIAAQFIRGMIEQGLRGVPEEILAFPGEIRWYSANVTVPLCFPTETQPPEIHFPDFGWPIYAVYQDGFPGILVVQPQMRRLPLTLLLHQHPFRHVLQSNHEPLHERFPRLVPRHTLIDITRQFPAIFPVQT